MLNKRQRISTWIALSGVIILVSASMELLGEIYFNGGWFHKIATFLFAYGSLITGLGVFLIFVSLLLNDWQESKNTESFVTLGQYDRIISVNRFSDSLVHLPIAGNVHQKIVAPSKENAPFISQGLISHNHFGSEIPKVQVMDDNLYQKLFGDLN